MDQNRQIRFLIPPFFFFLSLLWGLYWSDPCHNNWNGFMEANLIVYIGIVLASALPLGYLIGTISILLLKIGFFICSERTYESYLSSDCLEKMRKAINAPHKNNERKREKKLTEWFTSVVFGHGLLYNHNKGIYEWIVRRWNAFNISFHSIMALLLGLGIGKFLFGFKILWEWFVFTLILIIVLMAVGYAAWRDTWKMFEFLSELI